jgi:membrane protease YdiL (CAAX protease family)
VFLLRLVFALVLAAVAAALLAPVAAVLVARCGFLVPFPRIFDRSMMLTTAVILIFQKDKLRLLPLVQSGFERPQSLVSRLRLITIGLSISLLVVAILWLVAIIAAPAGGRAQWASIVAALPKLILAAAVIALVEEAFFRAYLMQGLVSDFGSTPALIVSSAIYSAAHLVRSPARFYLTSLDWFSGLHCVAAGLSNFAAPESAPALLGLLLLGLLLGRAFLTTASVYLSIGLHAGFVIGAKSWRLAAPVPDLLPHWLAGYSSFPLVSGAAAWIAALVLLVCIGPISTFATSSQSRPI